MSTFNLICVVLLGCLTSLLTAWFHFGWYAKRAVLRPKLMVGKLNNGVQPVVTIQDFEKKENWGSRICTVPETLAYYDKAVYKGDRSLMVGTIEDLQFLLERCEQEPLNELFAPYSSTGIFDLEWQRRYFKRWSPGEANEYVEATVTHRPGGWFKNIFLRVISWVQIHSRMWEDSVVTVTICTVLLAVVCLMVNFTYWVSHSDDGEMWHTTVAASQNGSVVIKTDSIPVANHDKPVMMDQELLPYILKVTLNTDPVPIGGDMAVAEVTSAKLEPRALRFPLSLGFKKGDTVYARYAIFRTDNFYTITDLLVLKQEEVQALLATGKFRYEP